MNAFSANSPRVCRSYSLYYCAREYFPSLGDDCFKIGGRRARPKMGRNYASIADGAEKLLEEDEVFKVHWQAAYTDGRVYT